MPEIRQNSFLEAFTQRIELPVEKNGKKNCEKFVEVRLMTLQSKSKKTLKFDLAAIS